MGNGWRSERRQSALLDLTGGESEDATITRPKNPVKYNEHGWSKLLDTGFFQYFLSQNVATGEKYLICFKLGVLAVSYRGNRPMKKGAEAPFLITT